jgi:type III secretion protein F
MNFSNINTAVLNAVKSKEAALRSTIEGMSAGEPTTLDLLMMQQEVQQWTMMTQIQSTLVKEVADAMKGVIQKAA